MNLNLVLAAAIAAALAVGYAAVASHHYDRGWAAHQAVIAAEIAATNAARDDLARELALERQATALTIRQAIEEALAEQEREAASAPWSLLAPGDSPAGSRPPGASVREMSGASKDLGAAKSTCGLGPGTLARLNAIK